MILKCNSWCILTILTVIWMHCTRIGDCCFFQCFIACFSDEGNGFCRAFLLHFKLLHIYNKKSKSSEFKPGTYNRGQGALLHFLYQKRYLCIMQCTGQLTHPFLSGLSTLKNIATCLKVHFPVRSNKRFEKNQNWFAR